MHLPLTKLATAGVVAIAVATIAAPSRASSAIPVAGSFDPTSITSWNATTAGGNLLVSGSGTHAWSGSFVGTSTVTTHFVVHPDGTLTYQGFITFTGSTPCGAGTFELETEGSGAFPGPTYGHSTTIDAAGSTIAMHADLQTILSLGPGGAFGTYSGDVTCG